MRTPLNESEIQDALGGLPGWRFEDDALRKTFMFSHFREAVSFLVRLAFEAERLNHHPELHNVYNRVDVAINTHDVGNKVTQMDATLAAAIESFAWS